MTRRSSCLTEKLGLISKHTGPCNINLDAIHLARPGFCPRQCRQLVSSGGHRSFFRFVTIHAFDGQTDRQTDGRTDGSILANTALHAAR